MGGIIGEMKKRNKRITKLGEGLVSRPSKSVVRKRAAPRSVMKEIRAKNPYKSPPKRARTQEKSSVKRVAPKPKVVDRTAKINKITANQKTQLRQKKANRAKRAAAALKALGN